MTNIGVLDLQGSVIEHVNTLNKLYEVNTVKVKNKVDLNKIDGLIIPGGESTTIGKLLKIYDVFDTLKKQIEEGLPVWGTCAGMILLAKNIIDDSIVHLGVMDISVRRNAYGSQLDSFYTKGKVLKVSENEIPMVFIRAPWIEEVGSNIEVLSKIEEKIVAAKYKNIIVTSFHPELTEDLTFHKYFVGICKNK
jgi:5'-phosphate synthase pdxT subunit